MAAIETVNTYRVRNHADLIAVAQIIAFGLAALGSLSLSMADDISLSMALRLRGNANALNRSAEQNRRALRETRGSDSVPHHDTTAPEAETPATAANNDTRPEPEMLLSAAAAQRLAAEGQARLQSTERPAVEPSVTPLAQASAPATADNKPQVPPPAPASAPTTARNKPPVPPPAAASAPATAQKRHQHMWAIAMVKEASELTASIPNLPLAERSTATIRAAALSRTAHDLLHGAPAPPLEPGALAAIARQDPTGK
jgi:hypothetical protein